MKNLIISFCLIVFLSCSDKAPTLTGTINLPDSTSVYLCEVVNEYYGRHKIIDSATVLNNEFQFLLSDKVPQLLFLGTDAYAGGYIFFDGNAIKATTTQGDKREMEWHVTGSTADLRYREFQKGLASARKQHILDSLDTKFMEAKTIRDTAEMARIKTESLPYYDSASVAQKRYVEEILEQEPVSLFKSYLYYNQKFVRQSYPSLEDIQMERECLNKLEAQMSPTIYAQKMREKLDVYAACAINAQAPQITGIDTLGNPLSLSDMNGQYVIVDFWNSYCKWCRLETPYILKALNRFKDKNVAVLGVSSDYKREDWIKAIHEDQSYWHHLLLDRETSNKVFDAYCIQGIPYIILVGPDGKILRKDLRHEEIENSLASYLN